MFCDVSGLQAKKQFKSCQRIQRIKRRAFTCTSQSKGSKKSRNEVKAQSMESKLIQKRNTHHQGFSRLIPGPEEESKVQKDASGSQSPKFLQTPLGNALRSQPLKARATWDQASRVKSTQVANNRLHWRVGGFPFGGYFLCTVTWSPRQRKRVLSLRSENLGIVVFKYPCSHILYTSLPISGTLLQVILDPVSLSSFLLLKATKNLH